MSLILSYLTAFLLLATFLSIDAKPIFPRTPGPNSYQFSDNKIAVTSHNAHHGLHAIEINQPTSDVAQLGHKSLVKRGPCMSRQKKGWTCSSETPSVAECVSKIQEHGQVGSKISVFYSGLNGRQGLVTCKQYFSCHPQIGEVVLWDDIVDLDWFTAQGLAIAQGNPTANPVVVTDPFQKRMSQAFGEATKGDAYVCTPEGNAPNDEFNQDLAWGGWEYPALTRNRDVTKVIRVDPSTGVVREIWKQGDPETPNAPKG
ncbi:MAG: hypothetical protein LQ344_002285 [Seirophora lacunosa]|nr:MAG: hypothetical protein LQ344_002285 [Seirophora lacunosa]